MSRPDWLFSNSALCGVEDQLGNDSPSSTVSRCGQGLAAVQQLAKKKKGSVDLHFGILRQFLVGPYSLGQAGNGSSSLADAPV